MISLRDNFNPVKREEIREGERGGGKIKRQTEKEGKKTLLNYVC